MKLPVNVFAILLFSLAIASPSQSPTKITSISPSKMSSKGSSRSPSKLPSKRSSRSPSKLPSKGSSKAPTKRSSISPSKRTTKSPSDYPSKKPTSFPTFTVVPTVTPSTSPTIKLSKAPSDKPLSTNRPTSQSQCLCMYATACSSNSDCCPGSVCAQMSGFTQCLENPVYRNVNPSGNSCYLTQTEWGCSQSSECCNPSASCDSNKMCNFQQACVYTLDSPADPVFTSPTLSPFVSPPTSAPVLSSSGPSKTSTPVSPSSSPTGPTNNPTVTFSKAPTSYVDDPLCCSTTSYASSWTYCTSAATIGKGQMTSCSTCAAYQCIDWTAGSVAMQAREKSYLTRTGDSVYFGVGSYGNDQTRAGNCYRVTAQGVDRDLIVQVVNQGGDVPDGNFDLQVGDGGYGVFDACVQDDTGAPQFDGTGSQWGAVYGGWSDISGCDNLPAYPHCGANPMDSMQDLCRWSFEKNLRRTSGNSNPTILQMCQVSCPSELYSATGLRRSDESTNSFTCGSSGISGGGLLTRMMDCTKPSYGWNGNVKGATYPGYELVVPCRRDGYTRINTLSNSPTPEPVLQLSSTPSTTLPSAVPVVAPTSAPVTKPPTGTPSLSPSGPSTPPIFRPSWKPTKASSSSNPFNNTLNYYVNPTYQADLQSSISTSSGAVQATLTSMRQMPSAYWIDVKRKIYGTSTTSVQGILLDAASKPTRQLVTFIVYDLPNRDCNAKASNGEICCTYNADRTCNYIAGGDCSAGISEYESTYIDPLYSVLKNFTSSVEIVLVIEPDSLPNLATNAGNPSCGNTATTNAYKTGTAYAINKFKALAVTMYLDGAHGGWLGWENNAILFANLVLSMNFDIRVLRGFSTNVANYQPIGILCPFVSANGIRNDYCLNGQHQSDPCCSDPCKLSSQYNPGNNELNYVFELYTIFSKQSPGFKPHFIIDSGRNGVTDMRMQCANWCNARGAGIGLPPTANTAVPYLVDAYYWLKTPGESDGCTQTLPDGSSCPRFDSFCGSVDSIGSSTGEPRAPQAGQWFDYQIKQLASNAVIKNYS